MTEQAMHTDCLAARTKSSDAPWARRLAFVSAVGLTVATAAMVMFRILASDGICMIDMAVLGIFCITVAMISASFWAGLVGFAILSGERDALTAVVPGLAPAGAMPSHGRTALVMPVHNEDPDAVLARLMAVRASLARSGGLDRFDFFLMSDSTDPAVAARENALVADQSAWLTYRRRAENVGRKAGNLADFCQRWGQGYDFMVVLDADSVMSGELLCRMAATMEANPGMGILQSLSTPVGQDTLFGRIVQFGNRLTARLYATGYAYLFAGDGNYFGHNAIIRVAPFMTHCELPVLSGKGPLAGEILSHDFVEAALMRRAGYEVWHLPVDSGSYEEMPTNLLDFAKRDRRWCQGNLQHARLLFGRGFTLASRVHLAMGVMSYLTSPLWLSLLLVGLFSIAQRGFGGMFQIGADPTVPWSLLGEPVTMVALFTALIAMFVLPRLLGLAWIIIEGKGLRCHGGGRAMLAGTVIELLFSALTAPVMMLFQSRFVVGILAGLSVGWSAQSRAGRSLGAGEATRALCWHSVVGLVGVTLVLLHVPDMAFWFLPPFVGLALAVPLAICGSREELGVRLRRRALFLVPEEIDTPHELSDVVSRLDPVAVPAYPPIRIETGERAWPKSRSTASVRI